jgi:hypothetical protein
MALLRGLLGRQVLGVLSQPTQPIPWITELPMDQSASGADPRAASAASRELNTGCT